MKETKTLEQLAAEKYPIYTGQKKNPATGKPDCPLTIRFALLARQAFIQRIKDEQSRCKEQV